MVAFSRLSISASETALLRRRSELSRLRRALFLTGFALSLFAVAGFLISPLVGILPVVARDGDSLLLDTDADSRGRRLRPAFRSESVVLRG
ncbi:hypothetical protein ACFFQF_11420 [Haladaptatus pallidirubidus]|uniref:hypothetical protein n=1 Tax=Haladaptatus pallidirubidus TaxID=1008152 RepID=UPI0035EDB8CB